MFHIYNSSIVEESNFHSCLIQGSACEYRHSEGARFNPMDCWHWLKGKLLEPKMFFSPSTESLETY